METAAIQPTTTCKRKGIGIVSTYNNTTEREVLQHHRALRKMFFRGRRQRSLFRLDVEVAPQESAGKHGLEGGEKIGEHDARDDHARNENDKQDEQRQSV